MNLHLTQFLELKKFQTQFLYLSLITMGVFPCISQAKYVIEYQQEVEIARRNAHAEEVRTQQLREQNTALRNTRAARLTEKRRLLESYEVQLRTKGTERLSHVRGILNDLVRLKAQVQLINQRYLRNQEKQTLTYRELNNQFRNYQQTETAHREELQRHLDASRQAETAPAILPARRKIHELYLFEINTQSKIFNLAKKVQEDVRQVYQDYEAEIAPYQTAMTRFQLTRLPSPARTLEHLDQISQYSLTRRSYFSRTIQANFPEVEEKIKNLVETQIKKDVSKFEKLTVQGGILSAWNDEVNRLFLRKNEIYHSTRNKVSVGCGLKMREFYDLYWDVLSHRDRCSSIEELRTPSAYDIGCALLKPLILEAESFFSTTAWTRMSLSLFSANVEFPDDFIDLKKRLTALKAHRNQNLTKPDLLLKAVKFHDQLLTDWQSLKESL